MTFIQQMHRAVADAGATPVVFEVRGETLVPTSGDQMTDLVSRARGFLDARGVRPGDRVALYAANSARWIAVDLAILGSGALVVPLYDRQSPTELAAVLADCEATLVLAGTDALRQQLLASWPEPDRVVVFDEVFSHAAATSRLREHDPADRVSLIYTSGTSGEPKGVLYTVANVGFMLERTARRMDELVRHLHGSERMFHYLPFSFASSRITLWMQLLRGNPLYLSTDLRNLIQELGVARPHCFLNVPAMLERIRAGVTARIDRRARPLRWLHRAALSAHIRRAGGRTRAGDDVLIALGGRVLFRRIKRQLGEQLQFVICGSAPLSEETQHWFNLVGIPVYQAYGLTETTAIISMDEKDRARPGFVGRPIEGVELRLTPEGELLCRGANVFPEYWNRRETSAAALARGWFHTGDQAELGPDGYLKIVGRAKDLVVLSNGLNIAPDPLEARLARHAGDAQVIVVGHGRPYLAALFGGGVARSAAERAIERLNDGLPRPKQVKRCGVVSDSWTNENGLLTANLKLRRRAIESRYASEIEALYT